MELSAVVLALAPPLAQHIYTAWRRRRGKSDATPGNIKELLARDFENQLLQKKIERDIDALAEHVVESLEPVFDLDGAALTPAEMVSTINAIEHTLQKAGLNPKFLLENQLDPILVAKSYKELLSRSERVMNEKESAFYTACTDEISRRIVSISDNLPGFSEQFKSEVLKSQGIVLEQGKEIVKTLQEFLETNKRERAYLVGNFDLSLRQAIRHRFGKVYIMGLDPETTSPHLSLSTLYFSLRAEARKRPINMHEKDSELTTEEILACSTRALIRGHAGSGKTTLLQWIALQCIERAFLGVLSRFNDYTRIFVRLREYYGRSLPTGPAIFATTSPALVPLVP